MTDRREILRRYDAALGSAIWPRDLSLIAHRFAVNHRIGTDHPLLAQLAAILAAHRTRVSGQSSPAETEATTRRLINA